MGTTHDSRLSVSVIIPTYNRAAFVSQAIESALAQTRRPDEIIVVDDGSTDGTERVLSQVSPPITVIRQANRGRSAARNTALRAATTDAVLFLDSDDLLMPRCVEQMVQVLEERPEVGVVYADAHLCDPDGNSICMYSEQLPGCRPSGMVLGDLMRRNFLTVTSMVRRSSLKGIEFEEGLEYFEDYDFWRQLAVRCEFQFVDEPLLRYRVHESMTSSNHAPEMLAAEVAVQQRIMAMPEFAKVSRGQRAQAFCVHGIKQAMLGETGTARRYFWRSIRTSPGYLGSYPLFFLSLLGTTALQFAILKRRQLAGNRLGTDAGLAGILEKTIEEESVPPEEGSSLNGTLRSDHSSTENKAAKVKVLVVGQTPPPHHGQAIMIERLVKSDLADIQLIHVRMSMSSHMNEIGRIRIAKITHMFAVIANIIFHRFADGVRILYYPPGGPDRVPMFRDIVILVSTRWLFDKTILHFHAGGVSELYDRISPWERWLFRRAFFGADAAIRLSELTPEDGRRLEARSHYVVPNGIDDPCPGLVVSQAKPSKPTAEPMRILFAGILRESKGVLVLIESCGLLAARGVPFQVELMGQWQSDEFANQVRERIVELNLTQHVHFLGVLTGEEKAAAFSRADLFCFPSFFNCETFGLVLVEAAAFGLPTVATRWRGIPSIVEDGKTGFLVAPHDPVGIADRLATLANDAELRMRLGAAARKKFEREYTLPRHIERMRSLFLAVASGVAVRAQPRPRRGWQPLHPEGKPFTIAALAPIAHTSSSHEPSGVQLGELT